MYNGSTEESGVLNYRTYEYFKPQEYLREYYASVGAENAFLLQFYHELYGSLPGGGRLLEFGGGPTIYQLLSASRKVTEIIFAEYLPQNRSEVARWISAQPESFNWGQFVDYVLKLEKTKIDEKNRAMLTEQVREKITRIVECNAYLPHVLAIPQAKSFDIVSSSFCLECIDGREESFIEFITKLIELVTPGGKLVLTMLKNARHYRIGDFVFPAFPVDEMYMASLLVGQGLVDVKIQTAPAEHNQGYEGFLAITATRPK